MAKAQSTREFQVGSNALVVYSNIPNITEFVPRVDQTDLQDIRVVSDKYTIRVRSVATNYQWVDVFTHYTYNRGGEIARLPLNSTGAPHTSNTQHYPNFTTGWSHTYGNIEMSQDHPVEVEIAAKNGFKIKNQDFFKAAVHPAHRAGPATVVNGKVYFTISNPAQVTIDINGQMDDHNELINPIGHPTHAISLFASPMLVKPPLGDSRTFYVTNGNMPAASARDSYDTLYFMPGMHDIGLDNKIYPGKTYYIPGDALVLGAFNNLGVDKQTYPTIGSGIRFTGYGTLTGVRTRHPYYVPTNPDPNYYKPIMIDNAEDYEIFGITVVDPANHSVFIPSGKRGAVRWAKTIGFRANSDGFAGNDNVDDCFMRTSDDSSYVRGNRKRCVFWKDHYSAVFYMSLIYSAPILIEDCDIIYLRSRDNDGRGGGLFNDRGDAKNGTTQTSGALPTNVTFRNLRIHDSRSNMCVFNMRSFKGDDSGNNITGTNVACSYSNIKFENVTIASSLVKQILLGCTQSPWNPGALTFDNVTFGGVLLTQQNFSTYFTTNSHVGTQTFQSSTIPVTSVFVNGSSVDALPVGQTTQLVATVMPANANNKNVTWSSSATTVATVSSTGLVTAVSSGTATITATTQDGNKTAIRTIIAGTNVVLPVVAVAATDASAGEPNNNGEFTFSRTGSTDADLTVNFAVSGTATSGSDYTSIGTAVTIPAGQASVTTTLAVVDNFTVEPSETVIVTLTNNAAYTVGAPNTATVTIADDDVLPTVTVAATDATAGEPTDNGAFTVTRTGDTSAALTVNVAVSGTASSGSDYTSLGTSATIPAGQASAVIPVTVVDNSAVEPSETVIVTLANNAAYTVGSPSSATVNITDNDVAPVEAFPWTENFTLPDGTTLDATPTSWTATPTTGSFRVLANEMAFNNVGTDGVFTTGAINISSGPVTVSLKVRGGSGLDVGQDFLRFYKKVDGGAEVQIGAANGPQAAATWTANIASGSSLVLVIRAHVTATSEYYYFDDLSVVPNVVPPVLPTVTIAASDASAGEPSNNGAFTVTRTGSSTTDALTVNYTVGGTATSGSDYTAIGTSVTILAGQASASVPVTVMNDTTVEVAETVVVTLSSNAAYTIGTANSATVNLTDDDQVGLPSPWVTADIGAVAATGSASYADPTFTIKGSGADIISTADEFRYVQQSSSGDCSIVARVTSIQNTHGWAKAGVMVRESTAANARNFFVFVTPSNGVSITWRTTTGGTTVNNTPAVAGQTAPKWLRVTRTGNSFVAHRSDNGTTWTQVGSAQTISMATTATLGLAVTSHADGTLCTSTMDNVTATP